MREWFLSCLGILMNRYSRKEFKYWMHQHLTRPHHGSIFFLADNCKVELSRMGLQFKKNQILPLAVAFQDASGEPAFLAALPVWASSNTTVVSLVASADGLSAVATATGKTGDVTISSTAGVAVASFALSVAGADPVTGTITAGAATDPVVAEVPTETAADASAAPVAQEAVAA